MAKKSRAAKAANKADRRAQSPRAQKTARVTARQTNRTARRAAKTERKISKDASKLQGKQLRNERVEIRAENAESRNQAISDIGTAAIEVGGGILGGHINSIQSSKEVNVGDLGFGSGSNFKDKMQDIASNIKQEFDDLGNPANKSDNKMPLIIGAGVVLLLLITRKKK